MLDKANACLADGQKLMESTKEKLRAKTGGAVEGSSGRSGQGESATTADGVAITIDKESVKNLSRSELEQLAINLHETNILQSRDNDFAFRIFFKLLYQVRDISGTANEN
ncbi:hypothetical protein FOMPIDRAFT_1049969 [Fomitopsis schrenkii]|uniref:Uncharacterized protein n=1 Tax=Fomitopsis schrenkii TaxID=2126942 RepID=S8EA19_FOMSC|nr:hypothetical protein FOMPIDRAFT_1049969 [Fomitopsis schrenkii]